jgi:hypothetical protein
MLLLLTVGFLADMDNFCRDYVPPFRAPSIEKIAIQEFRLGPQMVLRQGFSVGHWQLRWNQFSCLTVECLLGAV